MRFLKKTIVRVGWYIMTCGNTTGVITYWLLLLAQESCITTLLLLLD